MDTFAFDNLIVERYVVGELDENTYLVYEKDGKSGILVDPGAKNKNIAEKIKNLAIKNLTIFVTHGHADHIAGLEYFRKEFSFAKVAVSNEDSSMLTNSRLNLSDYIGGSFVCMEADEKLKEGDKLKLDSREATVLHIPGHTPGGLVLVFDEFIISGDSLFCEGVGRSDFPGGDGRALITSLKTKVLTLSDRPVFPGHGPETSISHELYHNPYL